jgi:hypothetical protein
MILLIVRASFERTHAIGLFADEQPRAATSFSQTSVALVAPPAVTLAVPLSMIAALNGGLWGRVVTSLSTDAAPALSPKMVTFSGSPPNAQIFCWTH